MQTPDDRHGDPPESSGHPTGPVDDDTAGAHYRDLIRSVNKEWSDREEAGDVSAQLSPTALSTIKESVRAESRHGAQVEMPPTPAGEYTMSELGLRTLVRRAVDSVRGVRALRTTFEHANTEAGLRMRGVPTRVRCRVSMRAGTADMPRVAQDVRAAVSAACHDQVDLSLTAIDVHIEDLHDD